MAPRRTHLRTTTSRVELITKEPQSGFLKEASSSFFGSTENVRLIRRSFYNPLAVTMLSFSSTIIQDIATMCEAGQASMAYFYFDFRNFNKQHLHDLIPSLLIQLSAHSDLRCDILSQLYAAHDDGKTQPSDVVLTNCLKQMVTVPDQFPTYLVVDALDECPDTSGVPSPRERVLQLVVELVELRLPNLHICVTSRPELDIRDVLEPLTPLRVSLHDQSRQKQDIVDYVKSIVYSDSERIMRRWKMEDKDLGIETLSERADGM